MPWLIVPARRRLPRLRLAVTLVLWCLSLTVGIAPGMRALPLARADDAPGPAAPALSGRLAYVSAGDAWLLTGGAPTIRVTQTADVSSVRWSPGGGWLLVTGHNGREGAVRPDGSQRIDIAGAWAPDDSVVAVSSADGGIDLVSPDTGAVQHLIAGTADLSYEPVAWSPDGGTLAVQRRTLGIKNLPSSDALWLVGRDGSELRELVPAGSTWPQALDWSPDGRWLAVVQGPAQPCVSCRADGESLFAVAADGSRSLGAGTLLRPEWLSWAPDSSALVAAIGPGRETYRDKHLVLLDLAGGSTRSIVERSGSVEIQPAFDPTGAQIAFTRGAAVEGPPFSNLDPAHGYPGAVSDRHVWLLSLADGSERELPPAAGWADESPRWTVAGSLLFVRWQPTGKDRPPQVQLWLADAATGAAAKIVDDLGMAPTDLGYYGEFHWSAFFAWRP